MDETDETDNRDRLDRKENQQEPSLRDTFAHRPMGESGWFRSFLADLGILFGVLLIIIITVPGPDAYPIGLQWAYRILLTVFFAIPFIVLSQVMRGRTAGLFLVEWTVSGGAIALLLHFVYVNLTGTPPYGDSYFFRMLVFLVLGAIVLMGSWISGGALWKKIKGESGPSFPLSALASIPIGFLVGLYFLFIAFFQNYIPGL